MKIKQGYTYDDLLLVPQYSTIKTRKNVDLSVDLGKGIKLSVPIISANMKNVTEVEMAGKITELGGLALLHRFCSPKDQLLMLCKLPHDNVGISVGVHEEEKEKLEVAIDKANCKIVCVDVAHGDSKVCLNMVEYIAKTYPEVLLIAGNVATAGGARRLYEAGANVIKVNVGSGSLCTTRIETGNGVPSMTALHDVFYESLNWNGAPICNKNKRKFKIIADGGLRKAGDLVKSLCFSDAAMLGGLLAGTDEAPGNIVEFNGSKCKEYVGSSTFKSNHIEGIRGYVPLKGPVESVITKLAEGIKSGLSYQGCSNLEELKENPEFIQITNSGLVESHTHSVMK